MNINMLFSKNTQTLRSDGSLSIMSSRRLRTWRFIQTVFIVFLTVIVALDLTARLAGDSMHEPHHLSLQERFKEKGGSSIDDDNVAPTQIVYRTMKVPNVEKTMTLRKSTKVGSKLRTMGSPDINPGTGGGLLNRFPKALLVGFAKCGTSALLAFLNIHPSIVTLDWEIDYFCERVYFKYSLHWYRERMPPSTKDQIAIEKSPCYCTEPAALDRIKAFNSSIKIMVIVRDPFSRVLSQHAQHQASAKIFGKEEQSIEDRYISNINGKFREAILMKWGTYNERIEELFARFPRSQIHVIDGDRFIKDPLPELKAIERFLGVSSFFSEKDIYMNLEKGFRCPRNRDTNETLCLSSNKGRSHVTPTNKFRRDVINYLRPHSLRFFELVGKRFNWTLWY